MNNNNQTGGQNSQIDAKRESSALNPLEGKDGITSVTKFSPQEKSLQSSLINVIAILTRNNQQCLWKLTCSAAVCYCAAGTSHSAPPTPPPLTKPQHET